MKKIFLLLLITFTLISCSTTRKVIVDFTYLDHPDYITNYYTAGKEELLLNLLNNRYFNEIGIELIVGTRTRANDTALYSFNGYTKSMDTLWYDNYKKYKKKKRLSLLIKHYEPYIAGLGYDGVMLVTEKYLLRSTFLHEFGHVCGLKHVEDMCNVMHYTDKTEGNRVELTSIQKLMIKKYVYENF